MTEGRRTARRRKMKAALRHLLLMRSTVPWKRSSFCSTSSKQKFLLPRISLAHEWSGRMRRGLRLTLADNGSGIAAKDLPRILDPFFSTKGAAGNGIGLSLVNNTVQKHHGLLHVRSSTRPGRSGTVFEI